MNHFVLPEHPHGERNTRYGNVAMENLVDGLLGLGCRIGDLQAKVFGGAAVLPVGSGRSIGSSNVIVALGWLQQYRIKVAVRRTGGLHGQQIRFHTHSGFVYFRLLQGGRHAADSPNLC